MEFTDKKALKVQLQNYIETSNYYNSIPESEAKKDLSKAQDKIISDTSKTLGISDSTESIMNDLKELFQNSYENEKHYQIIEANHPEAKKDKESAKNKLLNSFLSNFLKETITSLSENQSEGKVNISVLEKFNKADVLKEVDNQISDLNQSLGLIADDLRTYHQEGDKKNANQLSSLATSTEKEIEVLESIKNNQKMEVNNKPGITTETYDKIKEKADFAVGNKFIDTAKGFNFSIDDIPVKDFEKLGISKDELLSRDKDVSLLLSGEKSNSFNVSNIENLDIKASFKLDRDENSNVNLLVYSDSMEVKLTREQKIDRLTKIEGVDGDATKFVKDNNLVNNGMDSKTIQNQQQLKEYAKEVKDYSNEPFTTKDIKPDTWLKVNDSIANEYKEKYNIPVAKNEKSSFLGLSLDKIDNHSFKQHESTLSKVSQSLKSEQTVKSSFKR